MQWTALIALVITAGIGAMAIAGARLPREHRASRAVLVHSQPAEVWAILTNFPALPRWMPGVSSVTAVASPNGNARWAMATAEGTMTLEVQQLEAPRRFVTRIVDEGLPFGGTWTYELAPESGGTRVTVTEDGWIGNPIYRFFAHYVFGLTRTLDGALAGLSKQLGERTGRAPHTAVTSQGG